jgi:hypothetical protein
MASVYHIVAIRVNETSWAHVWRLHFRYLGTGYDSVTSGEPQYIKAYHGCYDPLLYPLFFPRGEGGEVGWNKKILYVDQGNPVEGFCVSL